MPITVLSKSNILRARRIVDQERRYRNLSHKRRMRIVFKIAWKIQRGRVARTGHR